MADNLTISKQDPVFPEYLDFQVLRTIGIKHVQTLSRQIWTDYNLHDPGVTILEVLCYALTDLGYRNNLDIADLLALKPGESDQKETNFFTADEILTCNPTTPLDWRQRLIDIAGVRNAWLTRVEVVQPDIYVNCADSQLQYEIPLQTESQALQLNPRGLYDVCLDLEPAYRQVTDNGAAEARILAAVKAVLCSYRNLCEDFRDVFVLGQEEIALCTDIELTSDADPEDVLVEIYLRFQAFLVPQLRFYTLQELLNKGQNPADIFAGRPSALHDAVFSYESHGFIDTEELEALQLPEALYTSDIYQLIMDVPGVAAIKKLSLINYIDGLPQSQGHPWYLKLTEKYRPVLSIAQSRVTFFKGDLPFKADGEDVERRYREQQAAYIKAPLEAYQLDLPVPRGSYYDLADHYSIHHEFPLTYGIGEDGLPASGVTAKRKAQAKQLKGYLVFFDQVLASYLAQLSRIRDLFSWESEADRQERRRTYFTQVLTNIPGVEEIIRQDAMAGDAETMDYGNLLAAISEDLFTYQARRHRFLDHLLARFSETFTDYVMLNYRLRGGRRDAADIIDDKAQYLREYPRLSRDRFRAFDYCQPEQVWDTENIAGFQRRVARLLGIDNVSRRSLSVYGITHTATDFTLTLGDDSTPQLMGIGPYPSLEAAQTAQTAILSAMSQSANLRPLVYRYFYHYGWEVMDLEGGAIATYNTVFPSQAARSATLEDLVETLRSRLAGSSPADLETFIQITPTDDGLFQFSLSILQASGEPLGFTGIADYPTEAAARQAAQASLDWIQTEARYRPTVLRQDDAAEGQAGRPQVFEYYGFGILDQAGQLLATSAPYATQVEVEDAIVTLQQTPDPLAWVIEPQLPAYTGQIYDRDGQTLLQGTRRYSYVWASLGSNDPTNGRVEQRWQPDDETWQTLLANLGTALSSEQPDEQLEIQVVPSGETSRNRTLYRFQLVRNDVTLIASEPFLSQSEAEQQGDAALQRLRDDWSQFGGSLINDSGEQREDDLRSLLQLRRDTHNGQEVTLVFLNLAQRDQARDLAWQHGNTLVELAQDRDNFRQIEDALSSEALTWVLTNAGKDQILGIPPTLPVEPSVESEIAAIQRQLNNEGLHLLEHILLRPRQTGPLPIPVATPSEPTEPTSPGGPTQQLLPIVVSNADCNAAENRCRTNYDPYSFWVSIVLPYWPERFRDMNFRRFVERTLRLEAPAHVALKICWVDVCQLQAFETAYRTWLEQLALATCQPTNTDLTDLTNSLNQLINILSQLTNVYPEGTLHDCEESGPDDNPIILDQTALGTANQ
ncbi:MAG: hypothetical protein AAF572_01420 [Cyanobacteria bacterium P01_B01_bin.77]